MFLIIGSGVAADTKTMTCRKKQSNKKNHRNVKKKKLVGSSILCRCQNEESRLPRFLLGRIRRKRKTKTNRDGEREKKDASNIRRKIKKNVSSRRKRRTDVKGER